MIGSEFQFPASFFVRRAASLLLGFSFALFIITRPTALCQGADLAFPFPTLQIVRTGTDASLSLYGQVNEHYLIDWTTNLTDQPVSWSQFQRVPGQGPGNPFTFTITLSPAVRFFKARREERALGCDLANCDTEANGSHCPTNGPPDEPAVRDEAIPKPGAPIKTVRLLFHRLAQDNGSDPVATETNILDQMATLNDQFRPWRLQFTHTSQLLSNSLYRDLFPGLDQGLAASYAGSLRHSYGSSQDTHLNVFVVYVEDLSFGGQAVFPWLTNASDQTLALTSGGGVVVNAHRFGAGEPVLAHEIGHALGLYHTHRGSIEVAECSACWERAVGGDPNRTGDFCSDTSPVPLDSNGRPTTLRDPCSTNDWPTSNLRNLMSAYPYEGCTFTPQQAGRMHAWIAERLTGWLDTNIPAAPTALTVAATPFGEVFLSWADNSWNETGIEVERSTNGSAFTPVITLPADTVQFVDTHLPPLVKCQYRVRTINGAFTSYTTLSSAVQTAPAPSILCVDGANPPVPTDPDCTNLFPTVGEAVGAAQSATIIRIKSGQYPETLLMENKVLRLEPRGGSVLIGRPQ